MSLSLEMGVGTTYGPNTSKAEPIEEAPIVNLHPSFVFSKDDIGSALAFPSLEFGEKLIMAHLQARERAGLPANLDDLALEEHPQPKILEEWDFLRAAWSLTRNGKHDLAAKRLEGFQERFPQPEPIDNLADWIFRFAAKLTQPHFEQQFENLFTQLEIAVEHDDFMRFVAYYGEHMSAEHARHFFEPMRTYLGNYSEFSQVHTAVAAGVEINDDFAAGSANFDATRMVYGNLFEAFATNVATLALLNNLLSGRKFDEFEHLSLDDYLKLDKAGRFKAFAANEAFAGICLEADSQLRNASHHGGLKFESGAGVVSYQSGKGGQGEVQTMSYARYLGKCALIFIQSMLLLRLEMLIARRFDTRLPI